MDKDKVMLKILRVLRNNMGVMNRANREEAFTLAREHGITVEDLIDFAHRIASEI